MTQPVDTRNAEHYVWGEVCEGWHLVKSDALSVIEERVPPGAAETRHLHSRAQQCFYVIEGEAVLEIGGDEVVLRAGQSCQVPPGVPHTFFNRSRADVRVLVISAPTSRGDRLPA